MPTYRLKRGEQSFRLESERPLNTDELTSYAQQLFNIDPNAGQSAVEGYTNQALRGAAQGAVSSFVTGPGAVLEAVGFDDNPLLRAGRSMEQSIEENLPVSQEIQESFAGKTFNTIGQVVQTAVTFPLGGAIGKGAQLLTGSTRAAKVASGAARIAIAGGTAGAAEGERVATELGINDPGAKFATIMGYGGVEFGSEMIKFPGLENVGGTAVEEGLSKFLRGEFVDIPGQNVIPRILAAKAQEGGEEVVSGVGQSLIGSTMAPEGERPGYATNGAPLPNPWDVGARAEEFALGAIGGGIMQGTVEALNYMSPAHKRNAKLVAQLPEDQRKGYYMRLMAIDQKENDTLAAAGNDENTASALRAAFDGQRSELLRLGQEQAAAGYKEGWQERQMMPMKMDIEGQSIQYNGGLWTTTDESNTIVEDPAVLEPFKKARMDFIKNGIQNMEEQKPAQPAPVTAAPAPAVATPAAPAVTPTKPSRIVQREDDDRDDSTGTFSPEYADELYRKGLPPPPVPPTETQKPTQTITGSNGEMAPEMPVQTEVPASSGVASISTPDIQSGLTDAGTMEGDVTTGLQRGRIMQTPDVASGIADMGQVEGDVTTTLQRQQPAPQPTIPSIQQAASQQMAQDTKGAATPQQATAQALQAAGAREVAKRREQSQQSTGQPVLGAGAATTPAMEPLKVTTPAAGNPSAVRLKRIKSAIADAKLQKYQRDTFSAISTQNATSDFDAENLINRIKKASEDNRFRDDATTTPSLSQPQPTESQQVSPATDLLKLPTAEVETDLSRRNREADELEAKEALELPKRRTAAISRFISEGAVVEKRVAVTGRKPASQGGGDVTTETFHLVHPDRVQEIELSKQEASQIILGVTGVTPVQASPSDAQAVTTTTPGPLSRAQQANALLDTEIAKLPPKAQSLWTPEVRAKATQYFDTLDETALDGLTEIQKRKVRFTAQDVDLQLKAEQERFDKQIAKKLKIQAAKDRESGNTREMLSQEAGEVIAGPVKVVEADPVELDLRSVVLSAASRSDVRDAVRGFIPMDEPVMSPMQKLLDAIGKKSNYNPADITESGINEAKKLGFITGAKNFKLTEDGRNELRRLASEYRSNDLSYSSAFDKVIDEALSIWDTENEPSSPLYKGNQPQRSIAGSQGGQVNTPAPSAAAAKDKPKTVAEADARIAATTAAQEFVSEMGAEARQAKLREKRNQWIASTAQSHKEKVFLSDLTSGGWDKAMMDVSEGRITPERANDLATSAKDAGWIDDYTKQRFAPTPAPSPAPAAAKEPWQMTKSEAAEDIRKTHHSAWVKAQQTGEPWDRSWRGQGGRNWGWLTEPHEQAIQQALREGKPVPAEVLADYPELQKPSQAPVRDASKPEQMTPEELSGYQNAERIQQAQKALDDAKTGREAPFINGFKSKAALVRARQEELAAAKEYPAQPDIWQTVIDASNKQAPIFSGLIDGLSTKQSAEDVESVRDQAIRNITDKGYVKQGELYVYQPSIRYSIAPGNPQVSSAPQSSKAAVTAALTKATGLKQLPARVEVTYTTEPATLPDGTRRQWKAKVQGGKIVLNAANLTAEEAVWNLEHELAHETYRSPTPTLKRAWDRLTKALANHPDIRAEVEALRYDPDSVTEEQVVRLAQKLDTQGPWRAAWEALKEAVWNFIKGKGWQGITTTASDRIAAALAARAIMADARGRLETSTYQAIARLPGVIQRPDGALLVPPASMQAAQSIVAFHGTPHKVDRFSMDKIGTGEGAQKYGWGLYFAENRNVGDSYRKQLTEEDTIAIDGIPLKQTKQVQGALDPERAENLLAELFRDGFAPDSPVFQRATMEWEQELLKDAVRQSQQFTLSSGNLYTVELLPDEADFLDWDKPLSEQSEKVKEGLRQLWNDSQLGSFTTTIGGVPTRKNTAELIVRALNVGDDMYSGSRAYQLISERLTPQGASQKLASLGIPGIKYLDGNSRDGGSGTSNYVIFDENLVRIIAENGKPVDSSLQDSDISQPSIKHSLSSTQTPTVTSEMDAAYLAAVEAGDSGRDHLRQLLKGAPKEQRRAVLDAWIQRNPKAAAELQRMVDEAAKAAGFTEKAYHGTSSQEGDPITRFAAGKSWWTRDQSEAQRFANAAPSGWTPKVYTSYLSVGRSMEMGGPMALEEFLGQPWMKEIIRSGITPDGTPDTFTVKGRNWLIPLRANQIKSADPVTLDDSGNVIPLSQRFKQESNDIRYSQRSTQTPTTVTTQDVERAIQELKGEIPGVEDVWYGTPEEFMAKFAGDVKMAAAVEDIRNGIGTEGFYIKDHGTAFIFVPSIEVRENDGSPLEAAKRVIRHEMFGHRGFDSLPSRHKQAFYDLAKDIPESELDALVERGYTWLADWRTNDRQFQMIAEEWLVRQAESMKRLPKSGVVAKFVEWLKSVWQYLTGSKVVPRERQIRELLVKMHAALRSPTKGLRDYRSFHSLAGVRGVENLPSERKQFMMDSLETAKAMAAAGKTSEEIRAATGWFPGKYDGKMRFEVPDEQSELRLSEFRAQRKTGESAEDIARGFFAKKHEAEMERAMEEARGLPTKELMALSRKVGASKKSEIEGLHSFYWPVENREKGRVPLGYLLDHDELYKAYPDLKWVPVSFNAEDVGMDALGQWNPSTGVIGINPLTAYDNEKGAHSTLLHEIQHWIQGKEGFAQGTSPDYDYVNLSKKDQEKLLSAKTRVAQWEANNVPLDEETIQAVKTVRYMTGSSFKMDSYRRTAGEIEARDVQARQNFTPEQRKAIAPYSSENIAKDDAIVMFGGGVSYSLTSDQSKRLHKDATGLIARNEMGDKPSEARLPNAETAALLNQNREMSEAEKQQQINQERTPEEEAEFQRTGPQRVSYINSIKVSTAYDTAMKSMEGISPVMMAKTLTSFTDVKEVMGIEPGGTEWQIYAAATMDNLQKEIVDESDPYIKTDIQKALNSLMDMWKSYGTDNAQATGVRSALINQQMAIFMPILAIQGKVNEDQQTAIDSRMPTVKVATGVSNAEKRAKSKGRRNILEDVAEDEQSIKDEAEIAEAEDDGDKVLDEANTEAGEVTDDTHEAQDDTKVTELQNQLEAAKTSLESQRKATTSFQRFMDLINRAGTKKLGVLNKAKELAAKKRQEARDYIARSKAEGRLFANPVNIFAAEVVIGSSIILEGIVEFTNWSQALIREIGSTTSNLDDVYNQSMAMAADDYEASEVEYDQEQKLAKDQTPEGTAQKIITSTEGGKAKRKRKKNDVRDLYYAHLKKPMPKADFVDSLVGMGVTEATSEKLYLAAANVIAARQKAKMNRMAKLEQKRAERSAETNTKRASNLIYEVTKKHRQSGYVNTGKDADSIRKAFQEQVKEPGTLEQFRERLSKWSIDNDVIERLFTVAARERDDLLAVGMEKQRQSKAKKFEIAEGQASKLIYKTEETLRQGSKDLQTNAQGDSVNSVFREHVRDEMTFADFARRMEALGVTEATINRLYRTGDRARRDAEYADILKERGSLLATRSNKLRELLRDIRDQLTINASKEANKKAKAAGLPETPAEEISWADIMTSDAETQGQMEMDIYTNIRNHPALRDLSPAEASELKDQFVLAWMRERRQLIEAELRKELNFSDIKDEDKQKIEKSIPRLLRLINLGAFDVSSFRDAIAPQYGLRSLSPQDMDRLRDLAQRAQKAPDGEPRNRILKELLKELQGHTNWTTAEMMKDYWVASVLTGIRTQTETALSVLNGFRTVFQISSAMLLTTRGNKKKGELARYAMKTYFPSLIQAVKEGINYIASGNDAFLENMSKEANSWLESGTAAGNPYTRAEQLWDNGGFGRFPAFFMIGLQRFMRAWDHINSVSVAESVVPLAIATHPELMKKARIPSDEDKRAAYKQAALEVLGADANGNPIMPMAGMSLRALDEQIRVKAQARRVLQRAAFGLDAAESRAMMDDANNIGKIAAYMNDPTGIGGMIYKGVSSFDKHVQQGAKNIRDNENIPLYLRQISYALAVFFKPLTGTQFIRFTGNKINELISFTPFLGLLRSHEKDKTELEKILLSTNSSIGLAIGLVMMLIWDDLDDEENGLRIEGSWANLSPDQKSQLMSQGKKPYTISRRGADNKWTSFSYQQWPTAGIFAAAGNIADTRRYQPDKYESTSQLGHATSAIIWGILSAKDLSSISQLTEMLGKSAYSRDPVQTAGEWFNKQSSNIVGGFIPRIVKDMDYWEDPIYRKPEGYFERWAAQVPIVRRSTSDVLRDIFNKPVETPRGPLSRTMSWQPDGPEYSAIGKLNAHGLWLPKSNPETRTTGKRGETRLLTEVEQNRYMAIMGMKYKEYVLRETRTLTALPREDALKKIYDDTNDIKAQAEAEAVR